MEYHGHCVRVQAHEGYGDKIIALQHVTDYEAIIAMKHMGDTKENPHYHLVIKTKVKQQAFRVRMKKVFDQGKGNEHMSIKDWDGALEAVSYLFHEDPDGTPFFRHNVPDETVESARELNKRVQGKVAEAKNRASWRIEDEVFKMFSDNETLPRYEEFIAKEIILFALRHDKYVPNDFLLKAMARKIQFRLLDNKEDQQEEFARRLISTVYRMDYDQSQQWLAGGGCPPR